MNWTAIDLLYNAGLAFCFLLAIVYVAILIRWIIK